MRRNLGKQGVNRQQHLIKRQRIELQVSNQADAQGLQNDVSRIYRQSLIPLIDQCCTALSSSDQRHRIELLEIDLGEINPDQMEKDLRAKLGPILRQALAAQISHLDRQTAPQNQQNQPANIASQLELLAFFVRTGSLPWWADATQPSLLDDCLTDLIEHAPEALRHLLRELGQRPAYAHRLIAHYADEQLAELAQILRPSKHVSLAQDIQTLISLVQMLSISAGWSRRQIRRSFWQHLLHVSSLGETLSSDSVPSMAGDSLYQAMLRRVAADLGLHYARLLTEMWAIIDQNTASSINKPIAVSPSLRASLQRLYQESRPEKPAPQADAWPQLAVALRNLARHFRTADQKALLACLADLEAQLARQAITPSAALQSILALLPDLIAQQPVSSAAYAGWLPVLEALREAGLPSRDLEALRQTLSPQITSTLKAALRKLAQHFSPDRQSDFLALLTDLEAQLARQAITPSAALQSILALLPDLIAQQPVSSATYSDWLPVLEALREAGLPSRDLEALRQTFVPQPEATQQPIDPLPLNRHFSQADELYIDNAGLVILWPFLNRFFDNQSLLTERTFKDEAARQRAVGLLQVLALGEADLPEYLLPLNKVLCGMELMAVFDLDPPVSAEEIEACTDLLQAIITQADILNNMSVSGFRGTFLLRKGILRTRDGVWLLQVERETYDVVLGRFPWSWEWVKLPWMTEPLRVEW